MTSVLIVLIGLGGVCAGLDMPPESGVRIQGLRCERRIDPAGIDVMQPVLSWRLVSTRRGTAQHAYQILVARDPVKLASNHADLWDSGVVESDISAHVPYDGIALTSGMRCYWKVRIWDDCGGITPWSPMAHWSMGLLNPDDWKAKWIGLDPEPVENELKGANWIWSPEGSPAASAPLEARYFRASFEVDASKSLESARSIMTADNGFELYINGIRAGASDEYQLASDFNILTYLNPGNNVIAVRAINRGREPNPAGLIGRIELRYVDGSVSTIATDATWRTASSETRGWNTVEFDDSNWAKALVLGAHGIPPWGDVSVPGDRRLPARMLRREFTIDQKVASATAYISGLGLSELYINGRKVGADVLSPALSEYDKRVFYVAHDVKSHVQPGANAIGVWLGNGRYYAPRGTSFVGMRSYGFPKLLLRLHIEFTDGTSQDVASDESWRCTSQGPIVANNEFDGETYDARLEKAGWTQPGFDDAGWDSVSLVEAPGGRLAAQRIEPIRVTQVLAPRSIHSPEPGVYQFDMGQNMVGWYRLKVSGLPGTKVTLRFAETLHDGRLYMDNLRSAKCEDEYILRGNGDEAYEPRFTYHGFRYVEMRGYPGEPDRSALEGLVVHDALERTGRFRCSNETINRIYENAVWGFRGNYRSIPTDCPQRDERQGWLGDRSEESRGESYVHDVSLFYEKWVQDIEDAQRDTGSIPDVAPSYYPFYTDNVTWPSSFVIVPGMLYEKYGDRRVLERHFSAMKRWTDYMGQYFKDSLMPRDQYGDWCVPPESQELIHSNDPARKTNGELIASAYFYHDLRLLAWYASLLGRNDDQAEIAALAERLKAAINTKYLDTAAGQYDNGTQTSCVLPLAFGITPERLRPDVFRHLTQKIMIESNGHVGTGLIGGQWLMRTLANNGGNDIAYTIATRRDYPSWGYMLDKGATTIWELWNGDTANPAMNSHNHVMLLGDFVTWLYEELAGIQSNPEEPGYKHVTIQPRPVCDLSFVESSYESQYGLIESRWYWENDDFSFHVTIPPNTTARVHVPTDSAMSVREGANQASTSEHVKYAGFRAGYAVYDIASGRYHFTSLLKRER